MAIHTQVSRDATSAQAKKLWDPSKILGIINTDPGYQRITCIGNAPSQGRRCRNPIRADNREFIMKTLDDISYLHPESAAVLSRLRTIAGPALCVRNHQNQAETIVMQWQRKIQQLQRVEERRPAKPTVSTRDQDIEHDQSIESLREQLREMREFLAQFREEANERQYQRHDQPEAPAGNNRQEEELKRQKREERNAELRRLEKKRLEKQRLEKEQLEKEKKETEEAQQRASKQAASNERIRLRAQKLREEREREKRQKEEAEKKNWDQSWNKYQERWVQFRASTSHEKPTRDTTPWPVKSGSYRDVNASNVKEFFERAVPKDANMAKLMRKECRNWHPDVSFLSLGGSQLTETDRMMVDMICRVVTGLLNGSAGRSAEFLG